VGIRRGFGPGFVTAAPGRFYRPYYAFRPRLSLGFGLWAGYPIAYPYGYSDPYYNPYGYGYGYGYGYASPYRAYGYARRQALRR